MTETTTGDMEEEWYKSEEYQRFWEHYRSMQEWYRTEVVPTGRQNAAQLRVFMSWCQSMHTYHKQYADYMLQHYHYYSRLAAGEVMTSDPRKPGTPQPRPQRPVNPTPRSAQRVPASPTPGATKPQSAANRRRQMRRERTRKRKAKRQRMSSGGSVPCQVEVRVQGDLESQDDIDIETDTSHDKYEFEMEITDEMMEFFTQSSRHRKERETQKKEEADNKEEDYINLADAYSSLKRTVSAPTEQPGRRRLAEMRELYGEGAAMIHGMETAMQLTFDRNCDIKDPKLWPYLPLNIKFDT